MSKKVKNPQNYNPHSDTREYLSYLIIRIAAGESSKVQPQWSGCALKCEWWIFKLLVWLMSPSTFCVPITGWFKKRLNVAFYSSKNVHGSAETWTHTLGDFHFVILHHEWIHFMSVDKQWILHSIAYVWQLWLLWTLGFDMQNTPQTCKSYNNKIHIRCTSIQKDMEQLSCNGANDRRTAWWRRHRAATMRGGDGADNICTPWQAWNLHSDLTQLTAQLQFAHTLREDKHQGDEMKADFVREK